MNGLWKIYANRRMAALLGIGFAAGLPSIWRMLGSSLQAWLGEYEVDIRTIGLFGLIGLPLAFNFVWAPLLDRYRPPVFARLGRRRGWLLIIQLLLMLGICALAFAGPTEVGASLQALAVTGFIVAFLVASQDVVADAYRIDVLHDRELGAGAAVFVNGYRIAMLAAGGGALFLSAYLSWQQIYLLLAMLMGIGIVATLIAPRPPKETPPATLLEAVVHPATDFFTRNGLVAALAVLGFIVLFKLPDAMANAMTLPLLQTGIGFSMREIAVVREWLGLALVMLGALAGGLIVARMKLIWALLLFGALQALSNLGFVLLALAGHSLWMLSGVVAVESFAAGLVTAGFIAFLMSQCNRRYSATQYALFTSLMYGSGALIGAGTGYLVANMGYVNFFSLSVVAGLPGMLLLIWLRPGTRESASAPAESHPTPQPEPVNV